MARGHKATLSAFYEGRKESEAGKKAFKHTLKAEGIEGDWRLVTGSLDDVVGRDARLADLPGHLVLASGRPVLIVPYAGDS